MRVLRRRYAQVVVGIVCCAVVAACTPPTTGGSNDPRPAQWAAELQAKLNDPAYVASLGSTDEERAQAVAAIRQYIASPGDGFDPAVLDANVAKNTADRDAADQQAAADKAQADLAASEARVKEVAGPLLGAPSYDDVKGQGRDETPDDAEETGDAMAAKPGAAEAAAAYSKRLPEVLARLTSGDVGGDPLAESLLANGYDGSGTITSTGPCDGRQGTRHAPTSHAQDNHNLRPGTLYTPAQDTFAGLSGPNRPVYSGDLQTRVNGNGIEQFLVEGHIMDTAIVDPVIGGNVATTNIDLFLTHIFLQVPTSAQPLEYWGSNGTVNGAFEMHYLCYAEDASLPPGSPLTRGYFQAWLPMTNIVDAYTIAEPGFQVRSAVSDSYWFGSNPFTYFFGADQRTVHIAPQPLAHHDPVPAGIGARLDDGFLVDDNGQGDDDLESLAVGPLTGFINSKISSLAGSDAGSGWVGGPLLYYWLGQSNPGSTNLNLSLQPAGNDDEYRFVADVQLDNVHLQGWLIPLLNPCFFKFDVDAHVTVTGSIDIGQTPSVLLPDLTLSISGVNIDNEFWSPVPLACNYGYLSSTALAERKITTAVNNAIDNLPEKLANLVSQRADVADYVNHNVTFGQYGNGFQTGFAGFDHTCAPYGCNGDHSGDVGMVSTGLEVSGDLLVTDRKTTNQTRRFPFSYRPSTTDPVSSLIRRPTTPSGAPFSAGAFVSGGLLNQLLRSVTEGGTGNRGVFDTSMSTGSPLNIRAQVAPFFLKQSISGKTLGLFLPDLRFDDGNYDRFAANLAVGLDVTYNPVTNALESPSIGVSDVAGGLGVVALRCYNLLWSVCTGVPALFTTVVNELAGNLLPQLTHNTIPQVTLPSIGSMPTLWADVENIDGNLAAFVKVGAQHVTVQWTSSVNAQFHFTATPVNYLGQGPVDYHWVVTDDIDGHVVADVTNQNPNYAVPMADVAEHGTLTNPHVDFFGDWVGDCTRIRRARATVTATQGSTSSTGSAVAFTLSIGLVTAPTQAQLSC